MRQAMSRPNSTCRSKARRRHHPRLPRPEKQGERSSFSSAEDESTTRAVSNQDRKSTRLNSSHSQISYAVFCLKKKKNTISQDTPVLMKICTSRTYTSV